ncbi:MAG: sigma-70 family RNA polymerase sigma factor [Planctomycetota bacterium]|nr:sigma-70 family RNA polymerase sigma factor [Planctomycetota bacterium]
MDEETHGLQAGLARGEAAAFQAAYDRHGRALYRAAAAMLDNPADAEDAVQDVFAALAAGRRGLHNVKDLGAYLFVSLRRAAGRIAQRRARQPRGPCVFDPPAAAPAAEPLQADRLRAALKRLPATQREALALKIDGELTFAQIGQVLGVSPNTAASRYRYALETLRGLMECDT